MNTPTDRGVFVLTFRYTIMPLFLHELIFYWVRLACFILNRRQTSKQQVSHVELFTTRSQSNYLGNAYKR